MRSLIAGLGEKGATLPAGALAPHGKDWSEIKILALGDN